MIRFPRHVLRGFGQMWLANSAVSGCLFLLGLAILSPLAALWSLLGALVTTGMVKWLDGGCATTRTGLAGVNGVLLGAVWIALPEIEWWLQGVMTVAGSMLMALVISPVTRWLKHRKSPLVLFSLPEVATTLLVIAVLAGCGQYDWKHWSAWRALHGGDWNRAGMLFESSTVTSARARQFCNDGLGWVRFHQRNYPEAKACFARCGNLADARCGLAWCMLKEGSVAEAGALFRCGGGSPDALEGLAWCQRLTGGGDGGFDRLRWTLPMLADAWKPRSPAFAAWLDAHVPPAWQRVPSRQWLCWLAFFLGIAIHSRISALVVAGTVSGDILAGVGDLAFVYNQLPVMLAMGGLYFKWRRSTPFVMVAASLALAAVWPAAADWPSGSLMFNGVLLVAILVFASMRKNDLVPLDLAMTSPERVLIGEVKIATAGACRERIRTATAARTRERCRPAGNIPDP